MLAEGYAPSPMGPRYDLFLFFAAAGVAMLLLRLWSGRSK